MKPFNRLMVSVLLFTIAATGLYCENASAQCGGRAFRTPVRSALNAIRPANWRILNQHRTASCGAPAATTCSGPANVADIKPCAPPAVEGPSSSAPQCVNGVCTVPTVAASSTVEATGVIGDRVAFRRAVMTAARQARQKGDMSYAEFAFVAGAVRMPGVSDMLMGSVHDLAIEEGLATTQAIDWDGLAGFIERILPIILQLIQLFGSYDAVLDHVKSLVLYPDLNQCLVMLRDGTSFILSA